MKKVVSNILKVTGALGLVAFVPPVFKGIVNAGNATGIAVSASLLAAGLKTNQLKNLIRKTTDKKFGKAATCGICIVLAAGISVSAIESALMLKAINSPPKSDSTTAVVLGCKVNDDGPSRTLIARLNATYDFLNEHPDSKCIVCGGQGKDEIISEADAMYNWLSEKGIPAERIIREDKSTSTVENLRFADNIIKSENLNREITIITSEYHQYRAGKIADKLNLEHYSKSGKTSTYLIPTYWVREQLAILGEWIS